MSRQNKYFLTQNRILIKYSVEMSVWDVVFVILACSYYFKFANDVYMFLFTCGYVYLHLIIRVPIPVS